MDYAIDDERGILCNSISQFSGQFSDWMECASTCDHLEDCRTWVWNPSILSCSFFKNNDPPTPEPSYCCNSQILMGQRTSGAGHDSKTSISYCTIGLTNPCAGFSTIFPNNTLGWYTTATSTASIPDVVTSYCFGQFDTCNVICPDDRPDCQSVASSVAGTCNLQWEAYGCSHASYSHSVLANVTGSTTYAAAKTTSYTTTTTKCASSSTASSSFVFGEYQGDTTITPVYCLGSTTVSSGLSYETWSFTATQASSSLTSVSYTVATPACSYTSVATTDCGGCQFTAPTVQVYYWPDTTTAPAGNISSARPTSAPNVAVTVVEEIIMTSPSVYLLFPSIYASNGCRAVGATHSGSVISLEPSALSTIYATGFLYASQPNAASTFDFDDLRATPVPAAAYERQVGCVAAYGCPTIYNDYTPTLSIPSQVTGFDPAWTDCYPGFPYGNQGFAVIATAIGGNDSV
ncbi:hypothetical protein K431DRAFT_303218 [Polychaeton citri CBS 116435]|uniref:Uncharacterized protein n=1 Tax=Polychaeton citri CBS 116435 TaxID=1314669 RepID=A0A9P4Q8S7_9PEZI|nr:hypothetical protein K431DRAFT_303218 [Polychaeton citri CBS 116435]